ncbi:hypothetical protein C5167_002402 [Papaver somniferum]|uniref:Retrotransposon gag domain-containing protein n=1 Tax=Papaver somniferum TaxID=3469 RepID=A0A4Y7KZ82_PAPSO|nr:hypothetical protein C5167_002402 [Papaver somniferum]
MGLILVLLQPFLMAKLVMEKSNPDYDEWIEQDVIILGWLFSTMSDSVLLEVGDLETSKAVWDALATLYASKTEERLMQLQRELRTIRKGESTMAAYLLRAKTLADQLAAAGTKISPSELKQTILEGLETSFDSIVTSLQTTMSDMSFEDFKSHLLAYELRLNHQQALLPTPSTVDVTTTTNNSRPPVFSSSSPRPPPSHNHRPNTFNQGRGSYRPPFPRFNNSNNFPVPCQLCGGRNHTGLKCWHRFDPNFTPRRFSHGGGGSSSSIFFLFTTIPLSL